jgi:hypothetical protein
MTFDMSYDDSVSFARAMYETQWQYNDAAGENILDFFDKPHKWDKEYQYWREVGGNLDKECLRKLEHWLEHKDDLPEDDDD